MDGSQIVAELASKLASNDSAILGKALSSLFEILKRFHHGPTRWANPRQKGPRMRLGQNLIAFKRGSVLRTLLNKVPIGRSSSDFREVMSDMDPFGDSIEFLSFRILILLCSSRLASQFVLKEVGEKQIVGYLAQNLNATRNPLIPSFSCSRKVHIAWLAITSVEGLLHFTRVSKPFRMAQQEYEILQHAIQLALPEECLGLHVEVPEFPGLVRKSLALFLAQLTLHNDSRAWILEKGWMDVSCNLLKSGSLEEMTGTLGSAVIVGISFLLDDHKRGLD